MAALRTSGEPQRGGARTPPSLRAIRDAAHALLAARDLLPSGWAVRGVRRLAPASVLLEVGPAEGRVALLEWHERGEAPIRAFLEGPDHAVGYRGGPEAWDLDAATTPRAVKAAVAQICELLALPPAPVPLRDVPPAAPPEEVPFSAAGFADWLGPLLTNGAARLHGWRCERVEAVGPQEVTLAFAHGGDPLRPEIKVRLRDERRPAAARTRQFDVLYQEPDEDGPERRLASALDTLATEVMLALEAHEPGIRFVECSVPLPPPAPGPSVAWSPDGTASPVLWLTLREGMPGEPDASLDYVRSLRRRIVAGEEAGAVVLRLAGAEPLRGAYVPDLVREALARGYEELHVYTGAAELADEAFCRQVLAMMPASFRLHVGIHGATDAVHEAVAGPRGRLADRVAAVELLLRLVPDDGAVVVHTLLTKHNAGGLVALRDLVGRLGTPWELDLPEPGQCMGPRVYRASALSMTAALRVAYPPGGWRVAELAPAAVVPCVAYAHARRTGHRLLTVASVRQRLHGLERSGQPEAPRVACGEAAGCLLAPACQQSVYALYGDEIGTGELRAVTRERLLSLPEGERIAGLLHGWS